MLDVRPPLIDLNEIKVPTRSPLDLKPHLAPHRWEELLAAVCGYSHGTIWHVNSTAHGGGVAEMLRPEVGYAQGLGLPVRWLVLDAPTEFFTMTKRIDNGLSGVAGDHGPLGLPERTLYQDVSTRIARLLTEYLAPGDRVFLHDPQTAGLVPHVRSTGATVVWRAHNGADVPNEHTARSWDFLQPFLDAADAYVFTQPHFVPDCLGDRPAAVIPPFIDPSSPKNQPMTDEEATAVLQSCGLLDGPVPHRAPGYTRFDGSRGEAVVDPLVIREGNPPKPENPTVVQVSRWDRVKDMAGVLHGFAEYIAGCTDADLLLVGPEVHGVADDPEAEEVFDECVCAWQDLPANLRRRVQLVALPMADPEANAAVVNAVQRHATVVVQKSLSEGFGLTATEAMWKAQPLVTSDIGGLRMQVPTPSVGSALPDPSDLAAFAAAVVGFLAVPTHRRAVGRRAHASVRQRFLPDSHLLAELALLAELPGAQVVA